MRSTGTKRARVLTRADLSGVNFSGANLTRANLSGANLSGANLTGANLKWRASLYKANLTRATLNGASLYRANLSGANLSEARLTAGADLSDADLSGTMLVNVDARRTTFTSCRVYGLSAWDVQVDGAVQTNLKINAPDQPEITVDNLAVSQFIHLLLNNANIRDVIDTITSKAVLILGRFTPERKPMLDAIREELHRLGHLPLLFDFDPAANKTRLGTISTCAHLARFVIADITDAKTVLQALQRIVPGILLFPYSRFDYPARKSPACSISFACTPGFCQPYTMTALARWSRL